MRECIEKKDAGNSRVKNYNARNDKQRPTFSGNVGNGNDDAFVDPPFSAFIFRGVSYF